MMYEPHPPQRHWRPKVEGPNLDVLGTPERRKLVECGIGAAADDCEQCLISVCEQIAVDTSAMCTARRYAVLATGMVGEMTNAEDGDEDEIALIERQIPGHDDRIAAVRLLLIAVDSAMRRMHDQHCDCQNEREHVQPPRVARPGQRRRGQH